MSTQPQDSAWADRPAAAVRGGLLAVLAAVPVAALVGAGFEGSEGALGGALGQVVPLLVLLVTWGALAFGRRRSAQAFAGALLASYLLKLLVAGLVLWGLRSVDAANPTALGISAVIGILAALGVEAAVVMRSRLPYVEPHPDPHH
jgi:hypothetical protein